MKRKIKLEMDALRVESFEAGTGAALPRGTVRANVVRDKEPVDDTEQSYAYVCGTNGDNYCAEPSYGCVDATGPCNYEMTSLCDG